MQTHPANFLIFSSFHVWIQHDVHNHRIRNEPIWKIAQYVPLHSFDEPFDTATVHEPKMWDNLKGQFLNHIDTINADLKAANLPELGYEAKNELVGSKN